MGSPRSIHFSSERGTTLIELLVTIPIALAVAGSILALTTVFGNNEKTTASRSTAIESAQVTLDRMTRDIRQAKTISPTPGTSATLTLSTMVAPASGQRKLGTVTWSCTTVVTTSVWTCSRSVTVDSTTTSSGPLMTIAGSNTIFTISSGYTYVAISAAVPTRSPATSSSQTLAIADGAAPLNLDL